MNPSLQQQASKPHATTAEIIKNLRSKGLEVTKESYLADYLDEIGYARLRPYFQSRCDSSKDKGHFIEGTKDCEILKIYRGDAQLRMYCFAEVGRFEIQLRNCISNALSTRFGSHPYDKDAAFKNQTHRGKALQILSRAYFTASKNDLRAKRYLRTYPPLALPSIWKMKEFLTFGNCAELLETLDGDIKKAIARDFGLPEYHLLMNWINACGELRNMCAHHNIIFNHVFSRPPKYCEAHDIPNPQTQRLRSVLQCMDHMSAARGNSTNIEAQVTGLLSNFHQIKPQEVGFSDGDYHRP